MDIGRRFLGGLCSRFRGERCCLSTHATDRVHSGRVRRRIQSKKKEIELFYHSLCCGRRVASNRSIMCRGRLTRRRMLEEGAVA